MRQRVSTGPRGQAAGETTPQSYRHVSRGEGQILQGFQDFAVSTQEDNRSVNSQFGHCALKAAVPGTCPQQGQRVSHKGGCKMSHFRRRQDLAFLDELLQSLTLLTGKNVLILKNISKKNMM